MQLFGQLQSEFQSQKMKVDVFVLFFFSDRYGRIAFSEKELPMTVRPLKHFTPLIWSNPSYFLAVAGRTVTQQNYLAQRQYLRFLHSAVQWGPCDLQKLKEKLSNQGPLDSPAIFPYEMGVELDQLQLFFSVTI